MSIRDTGVYIPQDKLESIDVPYDEQKVIEARTRHQNISNIYDTVTNANPNESSLEGGYLTFLNNMHKPAYQDIVYGMWDTDMPYSEYINAIEGEFANAAKDSLNTYNNINSNPYLSGTIDVSSVQSILDAQPRLVEKDFAKVKKDGDAVYGVVQLTKTGDAKRPSGVKGVTYEPIINEVFKTYLKPDNAYDWMGALNYDPDKPLNAESQPYWKDVLGWGDDNNDNPYLQGLRQLHWEYEQGTLDWDPKTITASNPGGDANVDTYAEIIKARGRYLKSQVTSDEERAIIDETIERELGTYLGQKQQDYVKDQMIDDGYRLYDLVTGELIPPPNMQLDHINQLNQSFQDYNTQKEIMDLQTHMRDNVSGFDAARAAFKKSFSPLFIGYAIPEGEYEHYWQRMEELEHENPEMYQYMLDNNQLYYDVNSWYDFGLREFPEQITHFLTFATFSRALQESTQNLFPKLFGMSRATKIAGGLEFMLFGRAHDIANPEVQKSLNEHIFSGITEMMLGYNFRTIGSAGGSISSAPMATNPKEKIKLVAKYATQVGLLTGAMTTQGYADQGYQIYNQIKSAADEFEQLRIDNPDKYKELLDKGQVLKQEDVWQETFSQLNSMVFSEEGMSQAAGSFLFMGALHSMGLVPRYYGINSKGKKTFGRERTEQHLKEIEWVTEQMEKIIKSEKVPDYVLQGIDANNFTAEQAQRVTQYYHSRIFPIRKKEIVDPKKAELQLLYDGYKNANPDGKVYEPEFQPISGHTRIKKDVGEKKITGGPTDSRIRKVDYDIHLNKPGNEITQKSIDRLLKHVDDVYNKNRGDVTRYDTNLLYDAERMLDAYIDALIKKSRVVDPMPLWEYRSKVMEKTDRGMILPWDGGQNSLAKNAQIYDWNQDFLKHILKNKPLEYAPGAKYRDPKGVDKAEVNLKNIIYYTKDGDPYTNRAVPAELKDLINRSEYNLKDNIKVKLSDGTEVYINKKDIIKED